MEIDIDGVLDVVKQQAAQLAILNGRLQALQKYSEKQSEELAELRKKCASETPPA